MQNQKKTETDTEGDDDVDDEEELPEMTGRQPMTPANEMSDTLRYKQIPMEKHRVRILKL